MNALGYQKLKEATKDLSLKASKDRILESLPTDYETINFCSFKALQFVVLCMAAMGN